MKIFTFTFILCLLFSIQQTAVAQSNNVSFGPKKTTTKTNSQDYKEAAAKEEAAKKAAARGEITPAGSSKGNKIVYGFLRMDKEGIVLFDNGKNSEKLINPKNRDVFRSVITALNYLSQKEKWQISNTYDLTSGSPNPAFILYRSEPIE